MINTLTCYSISCDVCGHTLDEWYWKTPSEAEEYARDQEEWLVTDQGFAFCLSTNDQHRAAIQAHSDKFTPKEYQEIIDYYREFNE